MENQSIADRPSRLFRKKPVVISAERFTMDDSAIADFTAGAPVVFMEYEVKHDDAGYFLSVQTHHGIVRASEGDWIVTGNRGERYPCRADTFNEIYEAIAGTDSSEPI